MKSYAGSTSTLDLPGGLSGGVAGVVGTKGSVVAAVDPDDDAYFGTVSSNSRYGSVDAEAANRSVLVTSLRCQSRRWGTYRAKMVVLVLLTLRP